MSMMQKFPRLTVACLSIGLLQACGADDEDAPSKVLKEIAVTGHLPNPVVFSWDGGVTTLNVVACEAASCSQIECDDDGYLRYDAGSPRWFRGDRSNFDAKLTSPLTYGTVGDQPDPAAQPLSPGDLHGVEVTTYGPCDPPAADCAQVLAAGCALFTP